MAKASTDRLLAASVNWAKGLATELADLKAQKGGLFSPSANTSASPTALEAALEAKRGEPAESHTTAEAHAEARGERVRISPGGSAFMAGAAWFGRAAVCLVARLADDVAALRDESLRRPDAPSAARLCVDLAARVAARRQELSDLYDAVLDHPPGGDDRTFEQLNARMPG
jgi:hypothetical protein